MLPPLPELGSLRIAPHIAIDRYCQDQHDAMQFRSKESASKTSHGLGKWLALEFYGHTSHIEVYLCSPSGNRQSSRLL